MVVTFLVSGKHPERYRAMTTTERNRVRAARDSY
jgi:hypothetical protein